MEGLTQIQILFAGEWRRTVRSARVVVLLLLFAMFTALALLVVGALASHLNQRVQELIASGVTPETVTRATQELRRNAVGFLFSDDPAVIDSLSRIPLEILVVFRLTLVFLPLYIALMGFDQLAGETGPRSIRYLLVRTSRSSILFGKFLGQAAVLISLVLIIDLGIFAYAGLRNPGFAIGLAVVTLLKLWAAAILYSLAYLALTTLCSALFRSAAVSLVFNVVVLFAFWLVDVIGERSALLSKLDPDQGTSPTSYIRYFSPSHYASGLLHPYASHYAVSGAAYAGFAVVFLLAAYAILRERDL